MNARWFGLEIKKYIFRGGIRPAEDGISVSFHYPGQFFRSIDNARWEWPTHIQSQNQTLYMMMRMTTFEVTLRRKSRKQKCNENWKEYDFNVARNHSEKIRCRPVYWIWDSSYPICNSSEKMKMSLSWSHHQIMQPCQSADKIEFEHMDKYVPVSDFVPADSFVVSVEMRVSGIKVIEQKRAYDFQSLIGNCGSYIGLLLGNYYINIYN
jgi:hypothetical protein